MLKETEYFNQLNEILKSFHQENMIAYNIHYYYQEFKYSELFVNNTLNVLIFDDNIIVNDLDAIIEHCPNITLVAFSKLKTIPFYYKYHIFGKLDIPLKKDQFTKLLLDLMRRYSFKSKIYFISNKNIIYVDYDDINYLKYTDRKLYLYTTDNKYQINGQLKHYLFLCDNDLFIKYKRSMIIKNKNFKHNKL